MKDMITSATIKFPRNKGLILIRGSLITRNQLTNIDGDNIVIDNTTFAIARRINRFTDMMVGIGDTFFFVSNNNENALIKAYECDSYADKEEDAADVTPTEPEVVTKPNPINEAIINTIPEEPADEIDNEMIEVAATVNDGKTIAMDDITIDDSDDEDEDDTYDSVDEEEAVEEAVAPVEHPTPIRQQPTRNGNNQHHNSKKHHH